MLHTLPSEQQARRQGALLAGASLLSVLAMAHHPTGVSAEGSGGDFIHGFLVLLVFVTTVPLIGFARLQGLGHPAVTAGLLAWGLALAGHLGAGTVNGFLVPALVQSGHEDSAILAFSWTLNQTLARLGVYASALCALCWGAHLAWSGGGFQRLVGAVMLLAGGASIAVLYSGHMSMDLTGAQWLYGVQALWLALLGALMWWNHRALSHRANHPVE